MRVRPLNMVWRPLPGELHDVGPKLEAALERWRGTPYLSGQRCRGVGADCIAAPMSIIDELDGRPRAQNATLPADTALHDPRSSRKAVAALRRLYAPATRLRWPPRGKLEVEPGDLLVVGAAAGGPGHLMMVGPRENTVWHSTVIPGFHQAGWGLGEGYERVFAVYRIDDRWRWAR